MVSAGWWPGTPPQQRQNLIAGRMLALPDGSWWLFGAWGRWYRWTQVDGQWHLCPPPCLSITRTSARSLQQGMPVPPVPPHVVPTGPDLAYNPPSPLAFVDAGVRTEVTTRVRSTVESAAALPTPDYPHRWGLFSSAAPSTVPLTWGVMLWCATAPVFDSRIDAQLLGLWSSYRARPLPDIDGPRWLTPPPLESLIGLYAERLRAGRVDAAVVVLRTMWAIASALREDVRFQPRADALITMLGVTLQNPTVDYGALAYGDRAVVQQWLTRCPPALAPALRAEASAGEHFRNAYYDLAAALAPVAGDPSERGYVEPRLLAAALLAADLAVVRQDVSGQVIGWLDPQVSEVMRAMLIQRDHPLRPFWPEGDRLPGSVRERMDAAGPAVRNTLLATMYGADLAWCRLGGGIPTRPRGFPSSVAILAEIIGPRRATGAASAEPMPQPPGIAPLAQQYPSNPGTPGRMPGVPMAQEPHTGPPGQAPAWAAPSSTPPPQATEAWDGSKPFPNAGDHDPALPPATEAWLPEPGAGTGSGDAGRAGSVPPATQAWAGTGEHAAGTPTPPPATQAWPGTGEHAVGTPTPPPATQAWPGTGEHAAATPASPPATQAWPGTGEHDAAGAVSPSPATETRTGERDPASDLGGSGSPSDSEARSGAEGLVPGGPPPVPATQVWSGTDTGEARTASGDAGDAGDAEASSPGGGASAASGDPGEDEEDATRAWTEAERLEALGDAPSDVRPAAGERPTGTGAPEVNDTAAPAAGASHEDPPADEAASSGASIRSGADGSDADRPEPSVTEARFGAEGLDTTETSTETSTESETSASSGTGGGASRSTPVGQEESEEAATAPPPAVQSRSGADDATPAAARATTDATDATDATGTTGDDDDDRTVTDASADAAENDSDGDGDPIEDADDRTAPDGHVNNATMLDPLGSSADQVQNATYVDWIGGTLADAGPVPYVAPSPVTPGPPRTQKPEESPPADRPEREPKPSEPPGHPGTRIMSGTMAGGLLGIAPMPEKPIEQIAPPAPAPAPKAAERFGIRFLSGIDDATELFDGLRRKATASPPALLLVGDPHTGQRRLTRLIARTLAGAGVGDGSVRTADGAELRGDHATTVTAILRGGGPPLLFERLDRAIVEAADPDRVVAAVTGACANGTVLIATVTPDSYTRLARRHPELARAFEVFRLPDLSGVGARLTLLHVLADERRVTINAAGLDVVRGDLARLNGHGDLVGARLVEAYLDRAVSRHTEREGVPRDRLVLAPVDFAGVAEDIEPVLRPPRDVDGFLRGLDEMIGLDEVKRTVGGLVAEARMAADRAARGLPSGNPSRHLIFLGRPGTGKATVAGLIGGIYAALNLLDSGHLVVCSARDFAGGDTAGKVAAHVDRAGGGVLLIEEAYLLDRMSAAVDELCRLMEERRDKFMVICASLPDEMEGFLLANPGFRAEFGAIVEFRDLTERQLVQLFSRLAERDLYMLDEELRVELLDRFGGMRNYPGFAFADTVRRLFDKIVSRQASRLAGARVNPAAVARLSIRDLPESEGGRLLQELHPNRPRRSPE